MPDRIDYEALESIVAALDALPKDDTEESHAKADRLALAALRALGASNVADAWERADARCGGFWYA